MTDGADSFQQKTQPNPKPMTFTPATQARIRQIHSFTQGAVGLSAKTVGQLGKYAQNFGATLARKGEKQKKAMGEDYKPGFLNKSMIAFSTIADGIDQAGRNLLASGSNAATNVVSHKYGNEAGKAAQGLAGGIKNVGLVYIDAMGVSRRAVIKSVAKGMVVGRMPNGQQLVVGSGDGGVVPAEVYDSDKKKRNEYSSEYNGATQAGVSQPGYGVESYGNMANAPPSYPSDVGEPLGGTLQGQNVREKR
jgi:spartin